MSAPWHMIEEKVEDAFQSALITEYGGAISDNLITGGGFDGFYIYKGMSLVELNLPRLEIMATSSEPSEPEIETPTGNQDVMLAVSVHGHKNEATRAGHSAYAAKLKDFCYASNLVTLLNDEAITDLTVFRTFPQRTERRVDEDHLTTETTVKIKAMPS